VNWIRPLSELTLNDIDQVGSKAAHLGAMLRAGFDVPEGFVITVDAFASHFGQITDPLVKPPTPKISAELMAEVVNALTAELGAEAEVAVRSSSTEEDLSFASFAGQHSTYYFVPPSQIDQALMDCWMSLWSKPALAYRRTGAATVDSGFPLRMAVIVQKMVPATRSGVIFSKDPTNDSNQMVLEACWGLGAALVDGHVSPDLARLDEEGSQISYLVRDKQAQVPPSSKNADGQRLQSLPPSLRQQRVLNQTEVEHIANLALQLETLFEQPQDIEWSYDNDKLYLLQSRPITSRQADYPDTEKLALFKPVAENFNEPFTPLSADLFAKALPKIGVMFDGRLYVDLDRVRPFLPFVISDAALANLMLLRPATEPLKLSWRPALKSFACLTALFFSDGANWIRAGYMQLPDLSRYKQVAQRLANNNKLSLNQTMRRLVWAAHSFLPAYHQIFILNMSSGRYFLLIGLLNRLVAKFAPDYPLAELPKTYHGRKDLQSLKILNDLDDLATTLHQDPDLLQQLIDGGTELPTGHPFAVAFDQFLITHGHRGPKELDLSSPRWREQPGELLKLLAATPPREDDGNASHGEFLAARDTLHSHLSRFQHILINGLSERISHYIQLRENTHYFHTLAFDCMRSKVLEIEQRLLHDGALALAGDIFFLTANEIEDLVSHKLDAKQAHGLVRLRRRQWQYQYQSKQNFAETFNVEFAAQSDMEAEPGTLNGLCASPGLVEGRACIVHNPNQAQHLELGDILVAPYTDPAWTPLFARARGIVVANGSFLSHAGTVARELHLPCLVDVDGCTQKITDGQRLLLNASAGTVKIL
jgi:phosphohistidine swiveling domain-containing protein